MANASIKDATGAHRGVSGGTLDDLHQSIASELAWTLGLASLLVIALGAALSAWAAGRA